MDLNAIDCPAKIIKEGVKSTLMLSGQHLLLKIHNDTELNEQVPQNKKWDLTIQVQITETDEK